MEAPDWQIQSNRTHFAKPDALLTKRVSKTGGMFSSTVVSGHAEDVPILEVCKLNDPSWMYRDSIQTGYRGSS